MSMMAYGDEKDGLIITVITWQGGREGGEGARVWLRFAIMIRLNLATVLLVSLIAAALNKEMIEVMMAVIWFW